MVSVLKMAGCTSAMLAHVLGILVGLGSVTLYMAAFFFPEVHRRHDFFWSGLGLFYASVLWFSAGQISPTETLGHIASVCLLSWFGWQTLTLRRKRTPLELQTPVTKESWPTFRQEVLSLIQDFLRQTPIGRFLPPATTTPQTAPASGEFRASSLRDVGYEFLDELEPADAAPPRAPSRPVGEASKAAPGPSKPPQSQAPSSPVRPSGPPKQPVNQAATPPQNQAPKPATILEKAIVIKDWLVDVVSSMTAPKPQKPVIEIPPRPARESPNTNTAAARSAEAAIHDSESARTTDPVAVANRQPEEQAPSVQIVDTQAVHSEEEVTPPGSADDSTAREVTPSNEETNWDDSDWEESNWDDF